MYLFQYICGEQYLELIHFQRVQDIITTIEPITIIRQSGKRIFTL